jgi:hypothetical protein
VLRNIVSSRGVAVAFRCALTVVIGDEKAKVMHSPAGIPDNRDLIAFEMRGAEHSQRHLRAWAKALRSYSYMRKAAGAFHFITPVGASGLPQRRAKLESPFHPCHAPLLSSF